MATIAQIAEAAQVSRQVVSKVLNGGRSSAGAGPQTRERIERFARELGYRPNSAAKAISTGRFGAIGLVMSQHRHQSTVFAEMLRGLHEGLDADAYHLSVNFIDDQRLVSEEMLPKVLGQAMVDGMILNYTHAAPERMVELIKRHAMPTIWLNAKRERNCVHIDDFGGAGQATRRLLAMGHRRVMYADFTGEYETAQEMHYSRPDRMAGYEAAMREAGHEPLTILLPAFEDMIGTAASILSGPSAPTAVIGYGLPEAEAFAYAAYAKSLRIGDVLRLVTFAANLPPGGPLIDVYELPEREMGRAAARAVLRRIDDGGKPLAPITVPFGPLMNRSHSKATLA